MVKYYYVKANRQDWIYPKDTGKPTDWDNFPVDKEQDFATFTKNQLYWKSLRVNDIIIGHSSYISSNVRGKFKFTPLPRISAIVKVTNAEEYSKDLECDAVKLKKVIEIQPIRITKTLLDKHNLTNAEPFRLGTNRCTITKLEKNEFEKIVGLISATESNIKKKIQNLQLK